LENTWLFVTRIHRQRLEPRPLPERGRRFDGERLLDARFAQEQFRDILHESGLLARPQWSELLDGVRPIDPVLVQRLDRPDSYYWIVPAVDEQKGLRAAASHTS
jgi:hypothetical protein